MRKFFIFIIIFIFTNILTYAQIDTTTSITNTTFKDGSQLIKVSENLIIITKNDSTFTVLGSVPIKPTGNIALTQEWQYLNGSNENEIIQSNELIYQFDSSHICNRKPIKQTNPLMFGDNFRCVYYPPQYDKNNKSTRTIKILDDYSAQIDFISPYDPQLTDVSSLRGYYPLNQTNGSFLTYYGSIGNYMPLLGNPVYVSGNACQDGLKCIRTFTKGINISGSLQRDAWNGSNDNLYRLKVNKTMMIWVNISNDYSGTVWSHVMGDYQDGGLSIRQTNGGVIVAMIRLHDSNWYQMQIATISALRGKWHLLVATWDNTSQKLGSGLDGGAINWSTSYGQADDYAVGQYEQIAHNGNAASNVNGTYQHAAMYERVLTQTEIQVYMNITGAITTTDSNSCTYTSGDWIISDACTLLTTLSIVPNKLTILPAGSLAINTGGALHANHCVIWPSGNGLIIQGGKLNCR